MSGKDDLILPFKVGKTAIRGRVVRLGDSINEILSRHPFDDRVKELLGETAVLAAMMGSSLKFDGRLIFQVRGDGPLSMLVSDYAAGGAMRAMASVTGDTAKDADLSTLLGKGHVAITIDQGPDMERYQGVTPVEGDTLGAAAVSYFDQSEQIPTAIKLAVGKLSRPGEPDQWRAGGIIAQFVPGEGGDRERGEASLNAPEDREEWDRAAAFLETTQADELLDPELSGETLLYRLFHEDGVRVFDTMPLRAECGCNDQKIGAVLARYSKQELSDMVEDGAIRVSCEFCRNNYFFSSEGISMKAEPGSQT